MKQLIFMLLTVVSASAAIAQTKVADAAKFNSLKIDLGKVKQGEPATAIFKITNISSKPLVIEQAHPGCGCTVADYTQQPIEPNKTGFIKATYNAANTGAFTKTITVKFTGIDEAQTITLTGEVLAPNKE
ncbi:MAG TPA: DUF1573 domain-containing protein [Chitinophagaceae bacterium]|nr:DUF1573 domain-containing protein [Chitinophagaceae bacterium]